MKKIIFLFFIFISFLFSDNDIGDYGWFCENGLEIYSEQDAHSTANEGYTPNCTVFDEDMYIGDINVDFSTSKLYIETCKQDPADEQTALFHQTVYTCDSGFKEIPNCDDNQTLDTENNICVDNEVPECLEDSIFIDGKCVKCPPNSEPDSSKSKCDCKTDYKLIGLGCRYNPCPESDQYLVDGICKISDCSPGWIPAPDYSTTYRCIDPNVTPPPPEDNTTTPDSDSDSDSAVGDNSDSNNTEPPKECNEPCNQPDQLFNYNYIKTVSRHECNLLTANGSMGSNWACPCGDVACYYKDNNDVDPDSNDIPENDDNDGSGATQDDNNDTTDDSNDDDTSDNDSNSTILNNIDLDGVIDKLQEGNNNIKSLGDITTSIGIQNHKDLDKLNNNLGGKLDKINSSILNSKTDMTQTNENTKKSSDTLDEIKEMMEDTHDIDKDDLELQDKEMTDLMDIVTDSFVTNFTDIKNVIDHHKAPTISYSGSCSLKATVLGRVLNIGDGLVSNIKVLRPMIMFIFNVISLVYIVKLSYIAFMHVSSSLMIVLKD